MNLNSSISNSIHLHKISEADNIVVELEFTIFHHLEVVGRACDRKFEVVKNTISQFSTSRTVPVVIGGVGDGVMVESPVIVGEIIKVHGPGPQIFRVVRI